MTATTLMTADDLLQRGEDERVELIDGVIAMMAPVGWEHGGGVDHIYQPLGSYVKERGLGVVRTEVGFLIARNPDTVLAPDIAFVRRDRLPREKVEGFPEFVPDLVVEVMSPGDTAPRLDDKVQRYLDAGVRLVWVVNLRRRTVTEYRPDRTARIYVEGETLSGGDVVPGFVLPVADIFARP